MAFSDSHLSTVCNLSVNGSLTQKREAISVDVSLLNADSQPLKGNYSVSVIDSKFAAADSSISILSHLLLTSELKGIIQSPVFYFKKESSAARNSLDLLMMTQGWRRYELPEVFLAAEEPPFIFSLI